MKATITISAERLQAMRDDSAVLWATPGASAPYWAERPSFQFDTCVATPKDFLAAAGIDGWDGLADDAMLTLDVEMPDEQPWQISAAQPAPFLEPEEMADHRATNGRPPDFVDPVQFQVRMERATRDQIDAVRGGIPRMSWVRQAIAEKLARESD